jgi:hypothetical protein
MFVSRVVTAVGRHVERLKIVIMACGSFNFFSLVFEEKSPYRVGCHVLNVFYLKESVTWPFGCDVR